MTVKLVRHIHSKVEWWYMGNVPGTRLAVVAGKDVPEDTYTIGMDEYSQFYQEVPEDLLEGKVYVSQNTGATFLVEKVYTNPDSKEKIAFGWRRADPKVMAHSCIVESSAFKNWTLKK